MNAAALSVMFSGLVFLVGWWFKWRLSKAREDRLRREFAESETTAIKYAMKVQHEANLDHENKVINILDGVSDDESSTMLSSGFEDPKISSTEPPQNEKS